MDCERIREIISSDYIDGELNEKLKRQIQAHLSACDECRAFEMSLRKIAVEPFKNLKEIRPPDSIWERIKENIITEQSRHKESVFTYLRNYLRPFFNVPKPVFATIVVAVFVITASLVMSLSQEIRMNSYFQEQEEFLSSLEVNAGDSITAGSTGLGTVIEEYFL
jgi:predicted anti-sigma-YlaC factor YlaD